MKILIPIWGFGRSGGDRVLSQLANNWIKAGHSVSFLVSQYSNEIYFPTNAEVIWINLAGKKVLQRSLSRPARPGLAMLLSLFGGLFRQSSNFDVVIANQSLTAWPVAIAARASKRFYYVQAYEPEYYLEESGFKKILPYFLSLLSYRLPLIKIANSSLYIGDQKVRAKNYVPPGIDLDIFHPKTSDPAKFKGKNKIVIGCIGRKEIPKGIIYLLHAYQQLGTRFHLKAAYGNLPDISKKIDVTIDIPSNDTELANFYRSIDLLIAPGVVQHGAYHYPVMESIACGTPVLHTGYLPGNDFNSWQCESRSALSIKNKIEEIVATDSHIIREKVNTGLADISNLSWPRVSERFIRIINEN